MNSSSKEKAIFRYLLSKSMDGQITPSEIRQLNMLLETYPDLEHHYVDSVLLQFLLPEAQMATEADPNIDSLLLNESIVEFAQYEKIAPEIHLPEEKPSRELIKKVIYPPKEKRKINKYSTVFLAMNAAALLLIVLLLKFAPPTGKSEVATVTDSIDAKWAGYASSFEKGARMATGSESYLLREGYAELLFDTNARVIVEAPAEFQIVADDRISLHYGKLYSQVPKEAIGFSVYTPNSKIIDLGTEFGVEADLRGGTQLHVIQGKTKLIAGEQSDTTSMEVNEGEAKGISAVTSHISPIACRTDLFVRKIDSTVDFIWKGQTKINLADIVGGGTGFGTGIIDSGIETNTGRWFESPEPELVQSKTPGILSGGGTYNKVSSHTFIDGVFVPDSREGAVQVTSAGHMFDGFVDGREVFWGNIFNGAWHASDKTLKHQLKLNGRTYGTRDNPSISLHSNQGITFDLEAIRRTIPGGRMVRFTSLFGVSETLALIPEFDPQGDINSGKVNCWVLIDGKDRFNRNAVSYLHGAIMIEIDINDEDRFLTLVVTESDDRRAYDWALFANPTLLMEIDTN